MYTYRYGDAYGEDAGRTSIEEIAATVTLTADFAAATIGGCIGCAGDIAVRRLHLQSAFDTFMDETVELRAHPKDYEIRFAPTAFHPDGAFETAEDVTLSHPERRVEEQLVGFWGGGFSNRRDREGNPRLVSGFAHVAVTEQDGSRATILGIFNAPSESFRNQPR